MAGLISLVVILAILLLIVLYAIVIRTWLLQWGATDEELQAELPGDSLLPTATGQTTHAISIHSSAEEVWPWLVQMGQERGGFYSYTWLENLVGCQIKNADQIVPEWQQLQIGDPVRLHPKYSLFVHGIEQNRALVLANCPLTQGELEKSESQTETAPSSLGLPILETSNHPNFIWAFVLEQKSERHTRLIVRVRVAPKLSLANLFRSLLFVEPTHFIMERKMLLGIKRRVEQGIGDDSDKPPQAIDRRRLVLRLACLPAFITLFMFLPAGTWAWPKGWLFILVVLVVISAVFLILHRVNPEVIVARSRFHKGTKRWDKILLSLYFPAMSAVLLVAALDDGRFHWFPVPWWVCGVGYALLFAGMGIVTWAEGVNKFFEVTVRIQTDRGHTVIDTGPYAIVRHPGYVGGILHAIGIALSLGSLWALIPAGIASTVLIVRTQWEDQTLQEELNGYKEYANRVRYKLIPGVW